MFGALASVRSRPTGDGVAISIPAATFSAMTANAPFGEVSPERLRCLGVVLVVLPVN
jgi:hypothetical protein